MKGKKDIKCSVNLWVFQVLLTGIVVTNYLCNSEICNCSFNWNTKSTFPLLRRGFESANELGG